ncbi:MAG: MaoC/PaaZ C-terminal domain-containing protein [Gammaproteobacteria bacterium]
MPAKPQRYYEDIAVGKTRESSRYTVSSEEILEFARRYDPQYFHADKEAAQRSRFGEVIASGIQIMAIWRCLDHEIAHDIAWICGVAWDDVRFPKALRPGDTVHAKATCLDKRISEKDPTRGVVVFKYLLLDESDEIIWSCKSTNLIERRSATGHGKRAEYRR